MFGLFKRKDAPEGPVEFENETEIEASAETVYRLLDFGDPQNQRRQMGDTVTDLGDGRAFHLRLAEMPGLNFHFEIIEADPFMRYAFDCVIDPPTGNLVTSREDYVIEALGENRCILAQKTIAQFRDGISVKTFAQEVAMMGTGVADSQYKIKLHAEEGLEAVMEFEKSQWF